MNTQSIEYQDVVEITEELDRSGVVCLEDVVSPEWLMQARADITTFLAGRGMKDYWLAPPALENHSAAAAFVSDPAVTSLLAALTRTRFPHLTDQANSSVLRILADPARTSDPCWFHYDACVVTMIVPLLLPEDGESGALVVFPNKRPFRRFVAVNIVEKALVQNGVYRRITLARIRREEDGQILEMKLGNAYLFWGYRSFHGNLACAPAAMRATLLLHSGRPHSGSRALKVATKLHQVLRGVGHRTRRPRKIMTTGSD